MMLLINVRIAANVERKPYEVYISAFSMVPANTIFDASSSSLEDEDSQYEESDPSSEDCGGMISTDGSSRALKLGNELSAIRSATLAVLCTVVAADSAGIAVVAGGAEGEGELCFGQPLNFNSLGEMGRERSALQRSAGGNQMSFRNTHLPNSPLFFPVGWI